MTGLRYRPGGSTCVDEYGPGADRVRALEEVARAARSGTRDDLADAIDWLEVLGGVPWAEQLVARPIARSRLQQAASVLRVVGEAVRRHDIRARAHGCRLLALEDVARAAIWGTRDDVRHALTQLDRHGGVPERRVLLPFIEPAAA